MNNISDINNGLFNLHQFNTYCNNNDNYNNNFGSCDKESISETPLTFHASSPSSSITSNIVNTTTANTRRQPRGKINKRACMNCRKLKVKCDGDALAGKDCTNCGKGTCVFDQSPRKNRQVENLTRQIDGMTETLRKTQENLEKHQKQTDAKDAKIDILQLERDISQSLFKCLLRFQHQSVLLLKLLNIVNEIGCRPVLELLSGLLSRILEENEDFPILPSSPSNSPSSCNYNYNLHPNSNRNASTSTTPIMTTPISTSNHSFSNDNNIIDSPVISDIFTPSINENNNGFNSSSFIIDDNLYYVCSKY
ncbi:22290_t:CDS:2 [Entrophospora sp. SA101]|nr:5553_t:CDS:2 [Entrophospora sp. SA101]CAJ0636481.1 5540_t:CDS:2 [Entrophospora sp. SA101]CAJ0754146.1 19885_t:CDS:2 [Entrophospora sp. SA101]CAJ0758146.1 22290_t:CDS:2 [Entrophospora sp. SA101]CAJ0828849.1 8805_t:CDS:2 [Entrophospora sp. SA101]